MRRPVWTETALGELADIRVSNVDKKTVARELPVRLCNYLDVYRNRYLNSSQPYMAASATPAEIERFRLVAGDVLITKDSETPDDIAVPAIIDETVPDLICGYHLAILRSRPGLDPTWLAKQVASTAAQQYFASMATGSTRYGLSHGAIAGLRLGTPPVSEQAQAATILRTMDEAIRKTEQLVAKLKQLRQGLLHDLLTRGIDDNGELRDSQRHPHKFKESVLGWIPRSWGVESVAALLSTVDPAMRSGPFGSALLKSELVDAGVPLLGIDNVEVEKLATTFTRFVTTRKAADLARYLVRPGDVMITIMGTVGRCCVVPDDLGQALSTKHVWALSFEGARYSSYLACLQFNYAPWVLRHFARDEQGGIMSAIRSDTLRTTLLPVPPREEARKIEAVMMQLAARLEHETEAAAKLRLLHRGLSEDLLTGQVRVADLKAEVAA
jgi:type I restriction enzyme, S subunit